MTFLHIDVLKCSTVTHNEQDAGGYSLQIEIFGLVLNLVIALRR